MKYAVAFALILTHATPVLAQNGKWNVRPPEPYTRADFERDCMKMANDIVSEAMRKAWIASCKRPAP